MPFYDEATMGEVRQGLEQIVAGWPEVRAGRMFGCPGFWAGGRLFALVVRGAVVLTGLPPEDREAMMRELPLASPFEMDDRRVKDWVMVPAAGPADLPSLATYAERSYRAALQAGPPTKKPSRKQSG